MDKTLIFILLNLVIVLLLLGGTKAEGKLPPEKLPQKKVLPKKPPLKKHVTGKTKEPSLKLMMARLVKAEAMILVAKKQAWRAKKYARDINKKMQILTKLSELPAVQGKFSDLQPCPNKVVGFVYAPQFKTCYYLAPSVIMMNWTQAEAVCQRRHKDAHLVSIDSAAKQKFLKNKWINERGIGNVMRYWTSGTMGAKGEWRWKGINKPLKYHNWIPVSARNNPLFGCISVLSNEGFYWGDVRCGSRHMVTCEIKL